MFVNLDQVTKEIDGHRYFWGRVLEDKDLHFWKIAGVDEDGWYRFTTKCGDLLLLASEGDVFKAFDTILPNRPNVGQICRECVSD